MIDLIPTHPPAHLDVPEPLSRLVDLAYNSWWTWNRDARRLFKLVAPDLWSRYRNPVRLLQVVRRSRLLAMCEDDDYLRELDRVADLCTVRTRPSDDQRVVAYVSAEYALHESLPIYSGGLGVLSGDHLKEASDMGLPLVGVGLFYRRGYFRQLVDADGYQQHFYPDLDAMRMPLLRVKDRDGGSLRVAVDMDGRTVVLRVWVTKVGRVPLLLLDSYTTHNPPEDRYITSQLYVRGRDMRLEQEIVLGRGTVATLDALGIKPQVIHMNEGHSAFLAVEDMRRCGASNLEDAMEHCRARHVFTTHTPVPAGNEVFKREKVRPYLEQTASDMGVATDELLDLGKAGDNHEDFNLTALALRLSRAANGVSKLHASVSREMWPDFQISAITNGIHVPTWLGREMSKVLRADETTSPAELAQRARELPDGVLWAAHVAQKHRLMRFARVRNLRQAARHGRSPAEMRHLENLLNPAALTLGFARRFAAYKRADLLFHDIGRLERLLCDNERPVQLLIAGKAHPADRAGQEIIRRIHEMASNGPLHGRIVGIEDYNLAVGRLMVRGVDVWLNTPEWPREASGTSGMKAVMNGVLHASVPDGWWAEADAEGAGFTIGEQQLPDTGRDAETLMTVLENELVPRYYDRGDDGLPRAWIAMMRRSMGSFLEQFSTRRMLGDYAREMYALTPVAAI